MRIISQNGKVDVPYEAGVIQAVEDKSDGWVMTWAGARIYTLATYSTCAVTQEVLQDLRIAYELYTRKNPIGSPVPYYHMPQNQEYWEEG